MLLQRRTNKTVNEIAEGTVHDSVNSAFAPNRLATAMKKIKELYTLEEINDLTSWFEARMDKLPKSLEVMPGVTAPDLHLVVSNYIDVANLHKENPTYTGQISHLFRIREVLMSQGMD